MALATAPFLFLFAGPNGSGKSTLQRFLASRFPAIGALEFVNADEIANTLGAADTLERAREAQKRADARRAELMQRAESFCSETVFSHESKIELLRQAKDAGYIVFLVIVCVESPALAELRVRQRVRRNGHDVPSDRIHERYPRTLGNLVEAVTIPDCTLVFDNSRPLSAPRLVLAAGNGRPIYRSDEIPAWAVPIVRAVEKARWGNPKVPPGLLEIVDRLTK